MSRLSAAVRAPLTGGPATLGAVRHLAIIPDGNRRWARARGLPVREGHRRGFLEVSPRLLRHAWEHGVHTVTLWAFSTENWSRAAGEVADLMEVYADLVRRLSPLTAALGARVRHLGRRDRLPRFLAEALAALEEASRERRERELNLAIDYGGRDELVRAVRRLLEQTAGVGAVDEAALAAALAGGDLPFPCPDVVVRTSGERRLSGFMPWQTCYSELFFLDVFYPDFTTGDLDQVLLGYGRRERRFGG